MATYNQIGYGSKGSDVTELQKLLNSNGYSLDTDGIFGTKTQAAVKDYQQKNNLDVDGIVGENTWGALTKANTAGTTKANTGSPEVTSQKPGSFSYGAYEKSDVVRQAEAMLQKQLANKPGAYQSAWQTQLDDALNKILNREKFSYDLNGDALYQQYKDQYMLQGQQASMDVMGQAAAMTGGYGNSYAQTVGQQTYQGYLQQLNDRVPELYQLALDQYNREGDELYNQYALFMDRENQDYGRYRDTVSDYNTELDRLTEDARYQSETDYGRYMDGYNMAYGQYRDQVSDSQWAQSFKYQQEQDRLAQEQWQAEFDEAQRQFNIANGIDTDSGGSSGGGSTGGSTGGGKYDAAVAQRQKTLRKAGYDVVVDGIDGPQTQAAWADYQAYLGATDPSYRRPVQSPSTEANDGGFTGSTYNEATAYLKANGQSASGLMTQSEWQRHKNGNNSAGGEHTADSYQHYLEAYMLTKGL